MMPSNNYDFFLFIDDSHANSNLLFNIMEELSTLRENIFLNLNF